MAHRLTLAHEQKLRLAGQGDIKRFFDQVEEKSRDFDRVRTDWIKCQAFTPEILPLRFAFQTGPFGEGSLCAKTLKKMLAGEPVVQFQAR